MFSLGFGVYELKVLFGDCCYLYGDLYYVSFVFGWCYLGVVVCFLIWIVKLIGSLLLVVMLFWYYVAYSYAVACGVVLYICWWLYWLRWYGLLVLMLIVSLGVWFAIIVLLWFCCFYWICLYLLFNLSCFYYLWFACVWLIGIGEWCGGFILLVDLFYCGGLCWLFDAVLFDCGWLVDVVLACCFVCLCADFGFVSCFNEWIVCICVIAGALLYCVNSVAYFYLIVIVDSLWYCVRLALLDGRFLCIYVLRWPVWVVCFIVCCGLRFVFDCDAGVCWYYVHCADCIWVGVCVMVVVFDLLFPLVDSRLILLALLDCLLFALIVLYDCTLLLFCFVMGIVGGLFYVCCLFNWCS